MNFCDHCGRVMTLSWEGFIFTELDKDVDSARKGESAVLCRDCCIETDNIPETYAISRNMMSGKKILIPEEDKGRTGLDPALESYWSM